MTAGDVITIVEDNVAKKGVYFDGTDDYILVDAHAVERVAANDTTGTYSAWVYINDVSGTYTVLSVGDNDSADQAMHVTIVAGKLRILAKVGGVVQFAVDGASIPARVWTHVAVVQNGTRPSFYVNGSAVSMTDVTNTDLTVWFDEFSTCDKFAIGIYETNNTHTQGFNGAIGQVKYWSRALSAAEIYKDFNGESVSTAEFPNSTYLRLNITMDNNGTTDSGAGADNGTLTGHAHYGGYISAHSMALERNCSGHAAEKVTTYPVGPSKLCSVIVRGD